MSDERKRGLGITENTDSKRMRKTAENEAKLAGLREHWNMVADYPDAMDELFDHSGYITIGYYLTGDETVGESARNMTVRLAEIANITDQSRVLDLGCGTGVPALDIAVKTGASVVGVDLAVGHAKIANEHAVKYKVKNPELRAEFHAGSYFDIPAEVKALAPFTHVIMQTSMFYAHHRIDEVLDQVSSVLAPESGVLVSTDFLRKSPLSEIKDFLKMNSMDTLLSKEEMEAALKRNGLEYTGGEVLDSHCVKCNIAKKNKMGNHEKGDKQFFRTREEFVREGKVSFQIIMAKKLKE